MYNEEVNKQNDKTPELRRLFTKLQEAANEAMDNARAVKKHVNMFKPEEEKLNEKEEGSGIGIIDQFDYELRKLVVANRIQRENIDKLNDIIGS